VSTSTNSPGGVPLEQEPFEANVDLGYMGDTLDSLEILDALGTYDFDGLTSFGFNLWAIFPDNVALSIEFQQMTISADLAVAAAVDIKPGSCPNSFNRKSRGKLPVAVLGTDAGPAQAVIVEVTVTGEVEFNGIGDPPLSDVASGDAVSLTFLVDSDNFVDGIPGDTRGYVIDQSSFTLTFADGIVTQGLMNPFPAGETPYFTLADGIPVSDRFWVSTSTNSPGGVPLEQEPFEAN
jgi:hypothetical protein